MHRWGTCRVTIASALEDARARASIPTAQQETMNLKMMKAGLLALCVCAGASRPVAAQTMQWTDKAFVTANVGVQVGSHDLTTTQSFDLFDETATVTTASKVKSGGLFDIGGGYRVWQNVAVGLTYSFTSSNSDGVITGSIPDPIRFDSPRPISGTASGLGHKENVLNFDATWMMPVTDKIDVGFSGGPSIFFVSQDVVSSVPTTEPGPTVGTPVISNDTKTTAGVNLGVDVTYLVSKKWGVGGIARYTWGSAKLAGGDDSLTLGGLQIGGGLRMRF
jgi:Outer membrane protein beta-barrel domain